MKMSRKVRLTVVSMLMAISLITVLQGQAANNEIEEDWRSFQPVRGERKSAATAIIMSSIFPGAGHFYVNRRTVGTFLYPIVEISLWAGYIYFNNKGQDIEKDYMAYADKHYQRTYQREVEQNLMNHQHSSPIYNDTHFRLEDKNSQHFYEDIGKYNKYIFGWEDWYSIYSYNEQIIWAFDNNGIWVGNAPTHPDHSYEDPERYDIPYSGLRADYIQMRRDAQENFDRRTLTTFGLAFNRVVSSLDVIRVTSVYNRQLRYASNFNIRLQPAYVDNQVTPLLNMTFNF